MYAAVPASCLPGTGYKFARSPTWAPAAAAAPPAATLWVLVRLAGGQKKPQITFEPKTRAPMPRLSDCHAAIEEGHHASRQKLRRLVAGQTGEITGGVLEH